MQLTHLCKSLLTREALLSAADLMHSEHLDGGQQEQVLSDEEQLAAVTWLPDRLIPVSGLLGGEVPTTEGVWLLEGAVEWRLVDILL